MIFTRVLVLCIAAAVLVPVSTLADSATATIAVSATVRRNCTITTAPLAFGSYDPVVANATTPLDATATVTIACTMGTPATIGLDAGSNALASQRRLTNASSAYMNYQMFLDSAHATVWGMTPRTRWTPERHPQNNRARFRSMVEFQRARTCRSVRSATRWWPR